VFFRNRSKQAEYFDRPGGRPILTANCVAPEPAADFNKPVGLQRYLPSETDLICHGASQTALHERAAEITRHQFNRHVFVRAVVEVSNYCRQNCSYCGMRRDNRRLHRFRAHIEQLAELLREHCPRCVTDINLQAGEDPVAVRELVLPLVRRLKDSVPLGVSVCLGTLDRELFAQLQDAGASIYILKFECADASRYRQLAAPGSLAERLHAIRWLAQQRWAVSSGFIVGLPGQTTDDLIQNLELAAQLPLRGCSVSPFIPGENTPLTGSPPADLGQTLNAMAALRLMRPDWVIPAVSALNLADKNGYRRGLRAGANLVTMNLTPGELRGDYVIYKRKRFIMTEERLLDAIADAGLTPSATGLAEFFRNGTAREAVATAS